MKTLCSWIYGIEIQLIGTRVRNVNTKENAKSPTECVDQASFATLQMKSFELKMSVILCCF